MDITQDSRAGAGLLALEPRMLFDGAALASVADCPTFDPGDGGFDAPLPDLEQPVADGSARGTPPSLLGTDQDPTVMAGEPLRFDASGATDEIGRGTRITVNDPDGPVPAGDYWMTIAGYHGRLTVDVTGTATVYENGTTHVSISGSLDELNDALDGLTFTPDRHYTGDTAIRLTVIEPSGAGEAAQIDIHVLNENVAPEGVDDLAVLGTARGVIAGNVLCGDADGNGRDFDADGDPLAVIGVVPGENTPTGADGSLGADASGAVGQTLAGRFGVLELGTNGAFRYTSGAAADALAAGETVVDSFTYQLTDPEGGTDTAVLRIELTGAQTEPPPPPSPPPSPPPPVPVPPPSTPDPLPVPPPPGAGPAPGPVTPLPPDGGDPPAGPTPVTGLGPSETLALSDPVLMATAFDGGGADSLGLAPLAVANDAFAPFSPTAVLGRIEAERERKAMDLRRGPVTAVAADVEEAVPIPKAQALKRSAAADVELPAPKVKGFSDQLGQEKKRIVPPKAAPGSDETR